MRNVCALFFAWFLGLPFLAVADSQLVNISTNGMVVPPGMFAGFIIAGDEPKRVAVLGERFNSAIDARVRVTDLSGTTVFGVNDSWRQGDRSGEISEIIGRNPGHDDDAALVLTLAPGVYIGHLESTNGQSGAGIIAVNIDNAGSGSSAFAGQYTGTFTGGDSGTFTANIMANGQATASGTANLGGPFTASGTVTSGGTLTLTAGSSSLGTVFMATIGPNGQLSGVWSHPVFGLGGTLEATRTGP